MLRKYQSYVVTSCCMQPYNIRWHCNRLWSFKLITASNSYVYSFFVQQGEPINGWTNEHNITVYIGNAYLILYKLHWRLGTCINDKSTSSTICVAICSAAWHGKSVAIIIYLSVDKIAWADSYWIVYGRLEELIEAIKHIHFKKCVSPKFTNTTKGKIIKEKKLAMNKLKSARKTLRTKSARKTLRRN